MVADPDPDLPGDGRVVHGTFVQVRQLPARPDRVFAAFGDLTLRRRWFRIPGPADGAHHELDFRVGGGELARGTFAPSGVPERIEYRSWFLDIVPHRRIVLCEELILDDVRRSLSLVTVELQSDDPGTRLQWTDQYALLALTGDGGDDAAHRRGSIQLLLNGLQLHLTRSAE